MSNKPYTEYWYGDNNAIKRQIWWDNGNLHREDGPAYIEYYEQGGVEYQAWSHHGKLHREDGPAVVEYYRNGNLKGEQWFVNGLPREDGPAEIMYNRDGSVDSWWWRKDGNLLHFIYKDMLEAYMKANNLTLVHLFTDPDPNVRRSAHKYFKKETA